MGKIRWVPPPLAGINMRHYRRNLEEAGAWEAGDKYASFAVQAAELKLINRLRGRVETWRPAGDDEDIDSDHTNQLIDDFLTYLDDSASSLGGVQKENQRTDR
jgi:hypothetical protein